MPNEPDENEGSGQTGVKPTITIAEKNEKQGSSSAENDTITIAEKTQPKKP